MQSKAKEVAELQAQLAKAMSDLDAKGKEGPKKVAELEAKLKTPQPTSLSNPSI